MRGRAAVMAAVREVLTDGDVEAVEAVETDAQSGADGEGAADRPVGKDDEVAHLEGCDLRQTADGEVGGEVDGGEDEL